MLRITFEQNVARQGRSGFTRERLSTCLLHYFTLANTIVRASHGTLKKKIFFLMTELVDPALSLKIPFKRFKKVYLVTSAK